MEFLTSRSTAIRNKGRELLRSFLQRLRVVKPKHIVWMLIIAYTIFFSWYTILKHYAFQTSAGDLGFFEQAFWSTIHGRPLYISLWDDVGTTTLAHHFQPIIFLILPIYAIYQSPETLLILQSFFLALGALPIYWITKKKFKETVGVVFAVLYLMYPALHGINQFDFHVSALAVPFFLFSFHYVEEKRYSFSAFFAILTLMCKEDAALTIVPLALYVYWKNYDEIKALKQKSRVFVFSLSLILIAAVWFFVTVQIIVPYFNKAGVYLHLGKFFPSLMRLEFPAEEILFAIDEKFLYVLLLLAPLQFMPLLSHSTFMITLPAWAIIIFSRHPPAYQIGYQYPYAIIPFIFVSAVYGLKNLALNEGNLKKILALLTILGVVFMVFVSPTPLRVVENNIPRISYTREIPHVSIHHSALYEVIKLIPPDASLSTQNEIFPHVCHRFEVHCGYRRTDEYVLIDITSEWFQLPHEEIVEIVRDYGLVASVDGIYLYKRGYDGEIVELPIEYGIIAKFYNNTELRGSPIFETRFFNIYRIWGYESPFFTMNNDYFSVRFASNLKFPSSGNYTFQIHSDDGFKLYIDDDPITERWGPGVFVENATIFFEKGTHKLTIEYAEYSANAFIQLYWKTPYNNEFEPVPEDSFYLES